MTTMHTSYGHYRWQRLPLGLISALEGLEGIICIADDILVFGEGTDFPVAEKDHDRRFVALMERCLQKNIKLQFIKLQFKLTEVKFMGNIIIANGMKADPDKVTAIIGCPRKETRPNSYDSSEWPTTHRHTAHISVPPLDPSCPNPERPPILLDGDSRKSLQ